MDPDPGGPNTFRSGGSGSGSGILVPARSTYLWDKPVTISLFRESSVKILLVTEKNDDSTQPREESADTGMGTGILNFALYVSSIDECWRSANKLR
jgi:hypothetical protein